MKDAILISAAKLNYTKEGLERLAACNLKPIYKQSFMLLCDAKQADLPSAGLSMSTPVLLIKSEKHAERLYNMLVRVTLRRHLHVGGESDLKESDTELFMRLSGDELAHTALAVAKAMNIPDGELSIRRF